MAEKEAIHPHRQGVDPVEQPALDPAAGNTAVERSDPGARHRTYSSKDTPTLTVMVMGRPVKASSNKGLEQDPVKHPRIVSKTCPTQGSAS